MNCYGWRTAHLALVAVLPLTLLAGLVCFAVEPQESLEAGLSAARIGSNALAREKLEWVVTNYPTAPHAAVAA